MPSSSPMSRSGSRCPKSVSFLADDDNAYYCTVITVGSHRAKDKQRPSAPNRAMSLISYYSVYRGWMFWYTVLQNQRRSLFIFSHVRFIGAYSSSRRLAPTSHPAPFSDSRHPRQSRAACPDSPRWMHPSWPIPGARARSARTLA
jgi:hypothetical protein